MVKLSVISQREVEDTLQDFEKRRYLILSALRAQKNLSTAAFFTKRERSSKVSPTSLWRSVHKLFTHAFVLRILYRKCMKHMKDLWHESNGYPSA